MISLSAIFDRLMKIFTNAQH